MKKSSERYEKYQGMERILKGWATTFRDPVQKGDTFDHQDRAITKIYRQGKVLFAVGQKIKGEDGLIAEIVHLEVDPNPGNITYDQAAKEGFIHLRQFSKAFREAFDENALWRPAWLIECKVSKEAIKKEKEEPAYG